MRQRVCWGRTEVKQLSLVRDTLWMQREWSECHSEFWKSVGFPQLG